MRQAALKPCQGRSISINDKKRISRLKATTPSSTCWPKPPPQFKRSAAMQLAKGQAVHGGPAAAERAAPGCTSPCPARASRPPETASSGCARLHAATPSILAALPAAPAPAARLLHAGRRRSLPQHRDSLRFPQGGGRRAGSAKAPFLPPPAAMAGCARSAPGWSQGASTSRSAPGAPELSGPRPLRQHGWLPARRLPQAVCPARRNPP